ncbi:efflux transporter periplasmic adaptor subunit [Vibrio sp. 10N.286.49.B3]|uniref:efflux RND transporter periplasmic adaptor subunit n=1 Tax=Vibrio sp. 10N.286.49.B3 TaxID=1880855 RepID=UPI000C829C8E|nr:efflux RND transporter periplasmic adaptor subunit [Vibrio sp. 10N.286.49.B3]PMH46719.1 efflux transporter periplasmic adaptor subunit [Vibrio sp. 10N.286.49.B3]
MHKQAKSLCKLSLLLTASALLLTGCNAEKVQPEALSKPLVKVMQLGSAERRDSLYFPAIANASDRSRLSFRVAGEVSQIPIKEGDSVKKGDVIAILDPTDFKLDVDNARAKYTVADSQYRRSQPLVKKGLLAKSQFDELAAQRQIALSELDLAKLHLSFTKLIAPVDGIISRINAEQYENIQVGQQILNIHSVDFVDIFIQLPDRLHTSQEPDLDESHLTAVVRVPSGNEYPATVKEFTTEPDPATGTFTVTLTIPMPENEYLLDGMPVEVTAKGGDIGLNLAESILVPIEAIFNPDGQALNRDNMFVWVLNGDNTVSQRQVQVGQATKSNIHIIGGLSSSDTVVIAGITRLRDKMQVSVIDSEAGL